MHTVVMRLSGNLDGGWGVIHVDSDFAAVTSTTASTAIVSVTPRSLDGAGVENHTHHQSELVLGVPARTVRLADVPHAEFTPLDGVMIGGALLCPVAGYKARRRFKL